MKITNDARKKYSIECPYCQKKLYACKSLFQEMGNVTGFGACSSCKKLMTIIYYEEQDSMQGVEFVREEKNIK